MSQEAEDIRKALFLLATTTIQIRGALRMISLIEVSLYETIKKMCPGEAQDEIEEEESE